MAGAGSGDSSLKQRPLQAKPFSPVARKIRIGRVPLLRQDEQRKHPRADRRRADKAEHGALGEYSEVAVRHGGTLHASILFPIPYGLRLLSLSKRRFRYKLSASLRKKTAPQSVVRLCVQGCCVFYKTRSAGMALGDSRTKNILKKSE